MKQAYLATIMCLLTFSVHAASNEACRFASIAPDAKRSGVINQFGQPDRVSGSHLSIDVYDVTDGSEVWVAWMGQGESERLLYVQHIGGDLDTPIPCK